ncbi:MAG: site-specific integrase [Thaumarchaeota archaeon]|nr:site-specific integrase [Nitrososphaerota archaeon]
MAAKKIDIHKVSLDKRKRLFKERFPDEATHFFKFLQLLSLGEINKGKEVGEKRQRKYIDMLSIILAHVNKPLNRITKADVNMFVQGLKCNTIKKRNGEPYSELTKQDIKLNLKVYLRWRRPRDYQQLTSWIDTRAKKKGPNCLTEAEVESLYNSCPSPLARFIVAILFDSGARIEEFLNVRFEDITEPTESFPYYRINMREEFSKTIGRNIGLYWKYSTKAVRDHLLKCDKNDLQAPVVAKTYDAVRMFLNRLGKRALKRKVNPKLFRSSSATYYAPRLNRQQLCIRYGWRFSSDMPDIYIKRAGVEEEQVKDALLNTSLNKLEEENRELKTRLGLIKETHDKQLETLQNGLLENQDELGSLRNSLQLLLQKLQRKPLLTSNLK